MALVRGGKGAVLIDDAAGVPVNITAWVDNVDWGDRTKDTSETTVFGQSAKTYLASLSDGSVKITGKFDAVTGGPDAIIEALQGAELPLTVEWQPEGPGTGKPWKRVEAILNTYTCSAPVGEVITFEAGWQASGAFTKGVLA